MAQDTLGLQRHSVPSDICHRKDKSLYMVQSKKNSLILGKDYVIGLREASCNRIRVLEALQKVGEVYLRKSFLNSGNNIRE